MSWSHHAELAALPIERQDTLLDHACEHRFSVRDLREELRRERKALSASSEASPPADPSITCPECGHAFPVEKKRRRRAAAPAAPAVPAPAPAQ